MSLWAKRGPGGRGAALLGVVFMMHGCQRPVAPPVARVVPHAMSHHGDTRIDNYYWMRERDNPEVIAYLEAENAHTASLMKHTEALQATLFEEMKARIKEDDSTVPARDGDYYYYSRTFEGSQYRAHCRKRGGRDGSEEIILDENALAKGHRYFRLGGLRVSPDHRYLAFAVDTNGSETYRLRIKDLTTGKLLPDEIRNTYYGLEWSNDNRTIFYTTLDEAKRPDKVHRHTLGTPAADDVTVHHEEDDAYHVSLGKTRSKRFILVEMDSQITSEVRVIDADAPAGAARTIHPREHGVEYAVAHHGEHFYITTNDQAVNFRLMRAPVADPSKANWSEVIPHRPAVKLDGVDAFRGHLAVYEREDGLRRIRIRRLSDGSDHVIEFDEPVYTVRPGENREFDTTTLRFSYTSMVTPPSVFDYDMEGRSRQLMKREEVLGGYDPANYTSERVSAVAADGTRVPISIVYRKGMRRDGGNATLLYGYGSYGASMDPGFDSNRISLLDRGFVYAIAHIRGGGDMGRPWYEDGKFLKKRNTFTDFIACAEHLVAAGYADRDRLAIMGGSAGGLLMGAVVNMRPDLFTAVVAKVPFVDVVTTMLDETIPLTVIEYEEWGNPHQKTYYDYMKSYSPYDNVAAVGYPHMLITAGLNDPRVQYWEPAKWTAKLRSLKTDGHRLLLKTIMGAGHGGRSGRYNRLEERAFDYAFILDVMGFGR